MTHYTATVVSGPTQPYTMLDVVYFDEFGEEIGRYGESMISFACTWRDIAAAIRTGLIRHGLDRDPVKATSPMVDLS
jgi:hypothetical protein